MTSAAPLVSVVTATYNMARHLPTSIRSSLGQTYPNVEVHVVDDGSTDETRQVIEPFLADARFHYHAQANGGQAVAKNRGIRESRGEFVAFLDADDFWHPTKLLRQIPLFDDPAVGVVYSDAALVDETGQPLPPLQKRYHAGHITEPLFVDNFVNFNSTVVRRTCFDAVGMFDEALPMGIDWDLWLRMSTRYRFAYLDERTVSYRIWPGQMSKNFERRMRCATLIMERFLRDHPTSVPPATVAHAWAHTMTGLGACYAATSRPAEAARAYVRALKHQPTYGPAWKGLAKLALGRRPDFSARGTGGGVLKRATLRLLDRVGGLMLSRGLTRELPRVLMYHRFSPGPSTRAVSSAVFERQVQHLARHYQIRQLRDLVADLIEGRPQRHAVAITIDDAYDDFATVALPILRRHRVPATLYVTTEFADGRMWMWPDIIHYVVETTACRRWTWHLADRARQYDLTDEGSRQRAWSEIADHAHNLKTVDRQRFIDNFARELGVKVPELPTSGYHAMTWDHIRGAAAAGIEIGSHTATHARLVQCTLPELTFEIEGSKRRIEGEIGRPVTSFCYPFGQSADIGETALTVVASSGYNHAVVGFSMPPAVERFAVRRFAVGDDMRQFERIAAGTPLLASRFRQ